MVKLQEAAALRGVPLFAGLTETQAQLLSNHAANRHFQKNAVVLASGDKADSLYIILAGSVKVSVADEEGREVILTILGPGEFFGEMALIDENPRSANIVTMEPCDVMVVGGDDFRNCLSHNSDLAMQIMRGLVRRLRDADHRIESLALVNVYGRVAQVLVQLADTSGETMAVNRRLTRQEIAQMIGASREMVSRVMRDLAAGGFVREERGRIVLFQKLATYAGEVGRAQSVKKFL